MYIFEIYNGNKTCFNRVDTNDTRNIIRHFWAEEKTNLVYVKDHFCREIMISDIIGVYSATIFNRDNISLETHITLFINAPDTETAKFICRHFPQRFAISQTDKKQGVTLHGFTNPVDISCLYLLMEDHLNHFENTDRNISSNRYGAICGTSLQTVNNVIKDVLKSTATRWINKRWQQFYTAVYLYRISRFTSDACFNINRNYYSGPGYYEYNCFGKKNGFNSTGILSWFTKEFKSDIEEFVKKNGARLLAEDEEGWSILNIFPDFKKELVESGVNAVYDETDDNDEDNDGDYDYEDD